ncbi:unnamed protein product [Urochloa humidicola]
MRCLVRITSIGITSITISCTSLIELDLKRSYSVDDAGLWELSRYSQNLVQDVKIVHLSWVSIEGFEMALQVSGGRLKKLKLLGWLRSVLSPELLQMLQACGCCLRWVDKQSTSSTRAELLAQ